jgi:predicted CXXCH cytochrome family protein
MASWRNQTLTSCLIAIAFLVVLLTPSAGGQHKSPPPLSSTHPAKEVAASTGNEACQSCHAAIYKSYLLTAMARASGAAADGLLPGDFIHTASDVHYRVYEENGTAWMSFERTTEPVIQGKRELLYYIGSGKRGRTYLFSVAGFVFEVPINWYAQKQVWDMAPAYQAVRATPMNLPALPGCLSCHTSDAVRPTAGTDNKYTLPLFAHAGITCERCHGAGAAHVSAAGRGPIVNPEKLRPALRDAVCMQCHLEGNIAIEQPGRSLDEFEPGEDLAEYVHYYVSNGSGEQEVRALGQSEALAQSVCKRKSGDKMWCGSCHDPHSSPKAEERVASYRAKCLTCHGEAFGAKHHTEQLDCTTCHMPRVSSADVAHTQATDHRILRLPRMPLLAMEPAANARLVRFPQEVAAGVPAADAGTENARDLALAWETVEQSGSRSAAPEAERYLRKALAEQPKDAALLSGLAFVEIQRGAFDKAGALYRQALEIDPNLSDAAGNLGVIEARAGHTEEAERLWNAAFARAPGRSAIGMNLARISCGAGAFDKARVYVSRVLEFNPDLALALTLQKQLSADPPKCGAR